MSHTPTINGEVEDIMAFFRVSERTVREWTDARLIGSCKPGRKVVFGEEDVVAWWCAHRHEARGMSASQAAANARNLWREFMAVRQADKDFHAEILQRLAALEDRFRNTQAGILKTAA